MKKEIEKGPVQILCNEIGIQFHDHMENAAIYKNFVFLLVMDVGEMLIVQQALSEHTSLKAPSEKSLEILEWVKSLCAMPVDLLKEEIKKRHSIIPCQEFGPCDHSIDMLDSCVSALQFGFEKPCMSRHAASAAKHIGEKKYGIRLFDRISGGWLDDYTRSKFYEALSLTASKTQPTAQKELGA